ncbi:hypothetical protein [Planomonospora sp. ID82291]|uniref:hypothetical protein n=1 Tax=Planomonospora sp. ID82291 TaxID=2738136 RepID=UPI0018C42253|nr:hypothetical protein [Planomonospora sp. ID82291]MBG0819021.1 hypothetical protein [Planomonospora sp. ID82291]
MAELVEDFNDTSYVVTISGNWGRSTTTPYQGSGCFKSAVIDHGGNTEATVTVPAGATKVKFWYRVSSESGYDMFRFFINSTEQTAVTSSGAVNWTASPEFDVSPGQTLTFRYSKDSSSAVGEDAAYIDNLTFTVDGLPPAPLSNIAAALTRASRW